jgi:hypothetical protein
VAITIVGPIQGLSTGLPGGVSYAAGITAQSIVKGAKGVLNTLSVIAPGSAGNLVIADSAPTLWSATVTYAIGASVYTTVGGTLYWATASNLNEEPPNSSYWATTPPAGQAIFTLAYTLLTVVPLALNWPFQSGIVVSAVPSAGSPQFAIAFT